MATIEDLERRVVALERTQNDTTETLRWVVAKLGQMQSRQDEHTLRLDRIETKLDKLAATVDALPHAMAEMITASEERMMAAINGLKS